MARRRPWRAVAHSVDPWTERRVLEGRTSAVAHEGLDRFIERHEAAGHTLTVWEVLPLREP